MTLLIAINSSDNCDPFFVNLLWHRRCSLKRRSELFSSGLEADMKISENIESWESFWAKIKPLLRERSHSFQIIFDILDKIDNPFIVETGIYRETNNIAGDGMSTVLFDCYLEFKGGNCVSIDLDKEACKLSRKSTKNIEIINEDSLTALSRIQGQADLLYLDSFDLDWNNHWPASTHHMKEFFSARNLLKDGTLVVVDDNRYDNCKERVGKGRVIAEYMDALGIEPLFDMCQIGWLWGSSMKVRI